MRSRSLLVSLSCAFALFACGSTSADAPAAAPPSDSPAPADPVVVDTTPDDEEPAPPDPPEETVAPPTTLPVVRPGCTAKGSLAGHPAWIFFTRPDKPCTGVPGSGLDSN